MGNKKRKATGVAGKALAASAKGVRGGDRSTRIALICFAVLALVGLSVGGIAFAVSYVRGRSVDYMNDDLSRYIYISEEDYKSFDVLVTVDPVTDTDVENKVLGLLYDHRDADPQYSGKLLKNQTVTPGDKVYIWYRGYTLGENGEKLDFSGGCNFTESEPSSLEIGSGSFITGFELGMVGKNPSDFSSFSKRESGEVSAGSLVQLTYSAAYPDGTTSIDSTALVDLNGAACDATFGEGFAKFLEGVAVGEQIEQPFVGTGVEGYNGDLMLTDMTVSCVYEVGDHPMTVEARFPYDYSEESLRSVDVYFDVYVVNAQLYATPTVDDSFITSVLKLDPADLEDLEGDTLVERWKSSLRAELLEEYDEAVELQIEEAFLDHLAECAEVKGLPQKDVEDYYDSYVAQWESEYAAYGSSYASLDEYVITNMNLSYYDDWRSLIRADAEAAITDKLCFYYVIRAEGLLPSDEELAEEREQLIDDYVDSYLEDIDCKRENYDSDEKYESVVAGYREQLLSYYEESYFDENAIFVYAMRTIREYASLTYKE